MVDAQAKQSLQTLVLLGAIGGSRMGRPRHPRDPRQLFRVSLLPGLWMAWDESAHAGAGGLVAFESGGWDARVEYTYKVRVLLPASSAEVALVDWPGKTATPTPGVLYETKLNPLQAAYSARLARLKTVEATAAKAAAAAAGKKAARDARAAGKEAREAEIYEARRLRRGDPRDTRDPSLLYRSDFLPGMWVTWDYNARPEAAGLVMFPQGPGGWEKRKPYTGNTLNILQRVPEPLRRTVDWPGKNKTPGVP